MNMNTLLVIVAAFLMNTVFAQDSAPEKKTEPVPAAEPRADLDYRSIRRDAAGREHDQIKTPRGTIFYKVKIQRIDEHRISIEHQDGRSLLEYDSIPLEWIKEFNIIDKNKKGSPTTSSRTKQPAAPVFDLSGKITITGDSHNGSGILVKSGEAFYVYTDCSIISGNSKITMKTANGNLLQAAQVIQCAEGFPLARIQVKPADAETIPVTLAPKDSGSKLQAHQYIYPLKEKQSDRPVKVRAIETNTIELSSRLSDEDRGLAIMTGSKEAIGLVLGKLPDNQRKNSGTARFKNDGVNVIRLDLDYTWKNTRMKDFLLAQKRILAFDGLTELYTAFSKCRHSGGKIQIPSDARSVFSKHDKDRNVSALLKFSDALDKKGMKANEKEVQRKFDSIVGSAMRSAKKQSAATSLTAFDWYHRHFFKESLSWRKTTLLQIER